MLKFLTETEMKIDFKLFQNQIKTSLNKNGTLYAKDFRKI